jgi:cell division septal protein FtsQ
MPTFFEIPKLSIDKIDITNETISQAALIKGELSNLVYLNYSALSGWEVKTKTTIAYIGKTDLLNRLARLKKIIANLEQKNAKPITLDLRYQQGYVLKKFE